MSRRSELQEYIRISATVLGHDVLSQSEVILPPPRGGSTGWGRWTAQGADTTPRLGYAKELVRFAARQYHLSLPRVAIRFSRLEGSAGRIRRAPDCWHVDIHEDYEKHPDQLLAIIAHELAHVVLEENGVRLEPLLKNEELTDTLAVMAGFGPVMDRGSQFVREEYLVIAVRRTTTKLGYLSQDEIFAISGIRRRIAKRKPVSRWAPVYLERTSSLRCWACGVRSKLPKREGSARLKCTVCSIEQRVQLRATALPADFAHTFLQNTLQWVDRIRHFVD